VNNPAVIAAAVIHSHRSTRRPQLSRTLESVQLPGAEGLWQLSRGASFLIYYY